MSDGDKRVVLKKASLKRNNEKQVGSLIFGGIRNGKALCLMVDDVFMILNTVLDPGFTIQHDILKSYPCHKRVCSVKLSPKGAINFSNRSMYGKWFYPYLNELISIIREVCGVSFRFNNKFSNFCREYLQYEYNHFVSDYFTNDTTTEVTDDNTSTKERSVTNYTSSTVQKSTVDTSAAVDMMNIEEEKNGNDINHTLEIDENFVNQCFQFNQSRVNKQTVTLSLPPKTLDDTMSSYISKVLKSNVKVFENIFEENMPASSIDLRGKSDDEKKQILEKNTLILMRFNGKERDAICLKTNPKKCVVYSNDTVYNTSYNSILEFKGKNESNPLDVIKDKLQIGKYYNTQRDGKVYIKKKNPDTVSVIRKDDRRSYSFPYHLFHRDPVALESENPSDYIQSVDSSSLHDDEQDILFDDVFEPCCESFVKYGQCSGHDW